MKDITAILIHYSNKAALQKALYSLQKISSRIKSIVVLQEQNMSLNSIDDWFDQVQFIAIKDSDVGQTLNDTISKLTSSYVLFLQDKDYLSSTANVESFQLSQPKTMLGAVYHNRNMAIHQPLLVHTSLLKKQRLLLDLQLPFKEARFPAWLSNVESSLTFFKEDLVRQSRKNSSANTIEKLAFIQKYQLKKVKTEHPSLSVVISNYNMEKYVETAVASCLLQSEQLDQLLIIDDGSTDNSFKQIQRWSDGEKVKVFNKKNGGKARALNELLPHVTSDFILELDADDWLDPDAVSVIKKQVADLPQDVSVLYGNLRKWKQLTGDVLYKGITKGTTVNGRADLLSYRFPLGPRVYRTSLLKRKGGFPVVKFENGKLYEDVSVLNQLIKDYRFRYHDFTVYNVREHNESITKSNPAKWNDFLKTLDV
ncbi:glycosyltransferase family 2 protein [Halobacillus shinanisalinarum]|uniref:Glycosyltransferase family 2 protein n=1 Tax=Halobacillus shinanisalinarum TaxID=2932258 RepID=A0ABY4H4M9_9BACI|nr:glycosyltransferase family A protein [Halobacillus shinanisalinarum]UOQ94532.1 glycosyltransferase family 2 protein [Halobacillus shinanisalinarum]